MTAYFAERPDAARTDERVAFGINSVISAATLRARVLGAAR